MPEPLDLLNTAITSPLNGEVLTFNQATGLWENQGGTTMAVYTLRMDDVVGDITYVGEALPGSAEDDEVWRIKRLDSSSGIEVRVMWADGDTNFDNRWDQRLTLNYS